MSYKFNPRWERYIGGGSGGGSAGSGKIEYPPYQVNMHSYALYGYDLSGLAESVYSKPAGSDSIFGLIENAIDLVDSDAKLSEEGTPQTLVIDNIVPAAGARYDIPDASSTTYLGGVDSYLTDLDTAIDELSDDTALDNAQAAFEINTENTYLRGLNRMSAQFADINAVNSSAFILGSAMMESSRQRTINEFRSKMDIQDRYIAIQAKASRAQQELEYRKTRLVADVDEIDQHVSYAIQSEIYKLELWKYGTNALGATSGAVSSKDSSNRLQSVLSGALTGGAVGAMGAGMIEGGMGAAMTAGTLLPAIGIGVAIGGLMGLFD